jgi:hypothetical protein
MLRYGFSLPLAMACPTTAPLQAQQPAARPPVVAQPGPRFEPVFRSYQPKLAHAQEPLAMAAAEHITISASTLALVLLIVLLIVLL